LRHYFKFCIRSDFLAELYREMFACQTPDF